MKVTDSFLLRASQDQVSRVICSRAYNVERDKSRPEVVSSDFRPIDETPTKLLFETHLVEYQRSSTGKLDSSRTKKTLMRYSWDDSARKLTWAYQDESGPRIRLNGMISLTQEGEGTRVLHEVQVEVRIPLIGKQIAKLVAKQIESGFADDRRLIEQHLALSTA